MRHYFPTLLVLLSMSAVGHDAADPAKSDPTRIKDLKTTLQSLQGSTRDLNSTTLDLQARIVDLKFSIEGASAPSEKPASAKPRTTDSGFKRGNSVNKQ